MNSRRIYSDHDLAGLAREVRLQAGKSQKEVAYELGVSSTSITHAEKSPERSLLDLRKRIIEKYSNYKLVGPEFRLVPRKPRK